MGRIRQKRRDNAAIFRTLKVLLLLGSALAALKVIFVDYTLDEEYQIVMAYRRLAGDDLFGAMWEPHQTSAFACVWLMGLYQAVTGGTTGVVLFLRVCTTLVQAALSLWLYRVCCNYTRKEYSFMLGLAYFNISPKLIPIPEFGNLQVWFFTVIVLSLIRYYETNIGGVVLDLKRRQWLILAGLGMAFEVLAYPSCLLLFPVFLVCIFILSKGEGVKIFQALVCDYADSTDLPCTKDGAEMRAIVKGTVGSTKHALTDCCLFAGVCGICALIWLGYVLTFVPLETFLRNVKYMLDFDLTHDVSLTAESKIISLANSVGPLLLLLVIVVLMGLLMWGILYRVQRYRGVHKGLNRTVLAVFLVIAAEAVQMYYWVILRTGYEVPMIHLLVLMLAAGFVWHLADARKKVFLPGMVGAVFIMATVIYISDLGAGYAVSHGMLGALFAVLILIYALERELGEQSKRWVWTLLVSLVVVSIFSKGFILRAGNTETNSILGIRGIIREGPAAGIFTNYMQAYITNCTYEEFEEYVEEGANCLIVNNKVGTAGTTPYLFQNCNICHFSVVDFMDPISYNENLLTYWSLYPEKQPDVIVVDCWYGQLLENEDSWIMQYIENDFNYSSVVDGRYVRYYFK